MGLNQKIIVPPPKMPVGNYKTYAIRSPIQTHFKQVSCKDSGCESYLNGWQVWLDDPRITARMLYLLEHSGKKYTKTSFGPDQNYMIFEPGQSCFKTPHLVKIDRPEFFLVGRGHWTVFEARKARQHTKPEFWVEDMHHQLDHLRTALERG